MNLPTIILACLIEKDSTGYDITKKLTDEAISSIWAASHQQIYRELTKLESAGYVSFISIPQTGKPDRKVYSITPSGINIMYALSLDYKAKSSFRDPLAASVMALDSIQETEDIKKLLEGEIAYCLQNVVALEKKIYTRMSPMHRLIIDRRISHLEWRISWAQKALKICTTEQPVPRASFSESLAELV